MLPGTGFLEEGAWEVGFEFAKPDCTKTERLKIWFTGSLSAYQSLLPSPVLGGAGDHEGPRFQPPT